MYTLRIAVIEDTDAMAYVHATCWQETYAGLLDGPIIDKFNVESRKRMWTDFFKKSTVSQRAYVAINSDKVVGIASWSETADHVELLILYVLSIFQHQGVGKSLFKQVEKDAAERGKRLVAWVLKGNKSTFFYEKMGLKLVKSGRKYLGDTLVQELMFLYCHQKDWTRIMVS